MPETVHETPARKQPTGAHITGFNVFTRVSNAFRQLREDGYFAEENWWCCGTCGWSAVPNDKHNKAVFYNEQGGDGLRDGGKLCLTWDDVDGPAHIIKRLQEAGLEVEHDGTSDTYILVSGPLEGFMEGIAESIKDEYTTTSIVAEIKANALEQRKNDMLRGMSDLAESLVARADEIEVAGDRGFAAELRAAAWCVSKTIAPHQRKQKTKTTSRSRKPAAH
jgi:hypothetical protein